MRPLIALTTTTATAGDYRVPQITLGAPYISAVEGMGGTGVLVTPAHDDGSIDRLLDLVAGVVLTGGEDVEPRHYGQDPHPKLGATNPARDEMELKVAAGALERRMPVLGICRGFQLLNVALGGTLYQDIPSQLGGDLTHEQTAAIGARWHSARVEPESRLNEIFGTTDLFINSFHHQAVHRLGDGLRAVAWAEDGVIEGAEAPDAPWIFGVQWHPERGEAEIQGDRRNPDRRLFYSFIQAAREYGEAPVGV